MLLSTDSQKGRLDEVHNMVRVEKILFCLILFGVNKETQPLIPDTTRQGKMEGGGAQKDKWLYPAVMRLALANLLSSTSICSTLICFHGVFVQLSMLL